MLISQAASNSRQAILSNFNIRLMLSKALTLAVMQKEDAFAETLDNNLCGENSEHSPASPLCLRRKGLMLDLINGKLEQLALKLPKD
jgi:hypothetical protein